MAEKRARPELGIVPYIVAGCMFMENLDATVIVTALPAMAHSFGSSVTTLSLGISVYMVTVAAVMPLSVWLSDRIGTRTVMALAIIMFAVTSLGCGLSNSLTMFVAMRVLQGAAAALMSPSGRLVVLRDTPKVDVVHAVAILTWPSLIAPILGPPLGGFLTSFASWRWIFFLNPPIAVVGLLLVLRYVPQQRAATHTPLDMTGFLLAAAALAALILGLEAIGGWGDDAARGGVLLAAGAALAAVAVRHFSRVPHPLVGLAPARIRTFAISALTGGTLTRIAVGATPFLLPLLFQSVLGFSAFAAGTLTLAYFAGNLGMKLFTTRLLRLFGFRRILMAGGAAVAVTVGLCSAAGMGLSLPWMVALLIAGGAARSLQFTALNTLAFADIPPSQSGAANTLNGLVQQVAMTFGVSLAALLLHLGMSARGAAIPDGADFAIAFAGLAAVAVAALLSYARLDRSAGYEVSGHRSMTTAPTIGSADARANMPTYQHRAWREGARHRRSRGKRHPGRHDV